MSEKGTRQPRPVLAAIAIGLFCCVVYGVALNAPLLFDDHPNITANPLLLIDGRTFDEWRTASLSSESGLLRRPLSMFTFALNGVVAGQWSPAVLKGTNLLIHLGIGGLVYFLALVLFRVLLTDSDERKLRLAAVLAAACWLLHPLHVSTVLYAVQRMAQLSTLFVLLGLVVFCRYRLRWMQQTPSVGEFSAAILWLLLVLACALLSKENGALLPWLIVLLEVGVFRGRWGGLEIAWLKSLAWIFLFLPVVAIVLVYFLDRSLLEAGYAARNFTLDERLITQARVLWQYIGWIFVPDIRQMGFQHDDIAISRSLFDPITGVISVISWLVVIALSLLFRRREPLFFLGVFFFLIGHSLESSVLPLEMVFEHRNYLPSVGLWLMVAGLLHRAGLPAAVRPRVLIVPLLGVLALMLVLRSQIWSDPMSFSRANVVNHPQSERAQFFYAHYLYEATGAEAAVGIDDETHKSMIVASYQHFLAMNTEAEQGSATALVMLHLLESYYFTGMPGREDRIQQLQQLMTATAWQASDLSALSTLVDCTINSTCEPDRERVLALIDTLLLKYPGSRPLLQQKYRILAVSGTQAQRREVLDQLVRYAPQTPEIYHYQIQDYMHTGEWGLALQAMFEWMQADDARHDLPLIKQHAERGYSD